MKRIYFFKFLYVFTFMPIFLNAQVNEQNSLALVDLYNSTDGPNRIDFTNDNTNWLTKAKLICWLGIGVEDNRVVKITLHSAKNVFGSLPTYIGNLFALQTLLIRGDLIGSITSEIGNLSIL